MSMVFSAVPVFAAASGNIDRIAVENQQLATYDLTVSEIVIDDAPEGVVHSEPVPSPRATLEALYADSAEDQDSGSAPEATGAPDDVRFSFGGNEQYVRASGSAWGSGSGSIISVEIAAEWTSSGFGNDGVIVRYYDAGTGLTGATASARDSTNYATDNTLYVDITADKATWTWADVGDVNPEIYYKRIGGPDGGTINVDALWIRVQYEDISLDYNIPVIAGWNLISVPASQSDTDILSVLDDAGGDTTWDRVKAYDQTQPSPWETYNSHVPSVSTLNDVDHMRGLWVDIVDTGSDGELVVSGSPLGSTAINLYAGWNLVGYPCLEAKTASSALAGVPYDGLEEFDDASPYFVSEMQGTDIMEPGNGYWIHVTSDCIWNVGDNTPPTFGGLVSATDMAIGNTVALSWGTATDPSYPITYNVYMSTTSGGQDFGTPDYMTDQTSLQVSGLTDDQEYFFVVRAEDSAGNEDTNNVERSATPTTPDITSPYITSTIPSDGTTGVPFTQDIIISFSEAIDIVTFAYSCTPNPGGWSESWNSPTNDQVTLYHNDFDPDAVHDFQVFSAEDLAGNPLVAGPAPNPWSFTTESAPDYTGPVTSGVAASPNPTESATTVTLTATVDDSTTGGSNIAQAEYFIDAVGSDGSGTAMSATDGNFNSMTEGVTASIDVSGWTDGAYTLYVHGRDSSGNWGSTSSTSLDVTTAGDTTPPQVVTNSPANGETGVAASANVIVQFNEEMDQANTEGAFSISPSLSGSRSWNGGGDTLTFNPNFGFSYSTVYTVTITTAATDLAGNTLDGDKDGNMENNNIDKWEFSFTTESEPDTTGPVVSNVQANPDPIDAGNTLTLTADVSDSTTGGSNIAEAEWSRGASAASAGSGTNMAASDGGFNEVTEAVTDSIDTTGWPGGTNTLWVRGRDSQNNWGNAVSTSVFVNAPDTTPPQVQSNTPTNGATGVAVNTNIIVDFNEEMDQSNTEGAFDINPAKGGSFSWNGGGDVMTFNPSTDLATGTTYTVTIHTTATDLAGNTLDGDKDGNMEADNKDKWEFSFTTAGGGPGAKYAVCVGINLYDYQNDLTYCVNDASECRTNLQGEGYSVTYLTNSQATKTNILGALDDMGADESSGDYTAFTYSGHGGTSSGIYFICPKECYYISDMITDDEMADIMDYYDSTHQLTFFDSCNSGGLSLGLSGRLHIMAAASNQYSWDGQPDIANGVWTYYFWEDGYRYGGAGSLALETVFNYAKPLASAYVSSNYGYTMTPQISDGYSGSFYL